MIEVHGGDTPNVFKVLVMLEETGFEYRRMPVDIFKGEQFSPEFLRISPNNKVPAIIDHAPSDGGDSLSVFESGAILLYLADKVGSLIPTSVRQRSAVIEWVMWQMAGQGPMLGQAGHFMNYAPEPIPYAIRRYSDEAQRLYRVLDTRLRGRSFLVGDYSIADIACWPWILFHAYHHVSLEHYPDVYRWFRAIESRPAVKRALEDFVVPQRMTITPEMRKILFNKRTDN